MGSKSLFYGEKILVASIYMMPLVFFPFGYEFFEHPKTYLLYFLTIILSFFFYNALIKEKLINIYFKSNISKAYLVLLSIFIISSIIGISFRKSIIGSFYRADGFLTYIALLLISIYTFVLAQKRTTSKYNTEKAFVLSSLVVAIVAVVHYIFVIYILKDHSYLYDSRAVGTLGQPNFLGGYILLITPLFFKIKNTLTKRLIYVYFMSISLALLLSFSKSSIILFSLYLTFMYFKGKLIKKDIFLSVLLSVVLIVMLLSGGFSDIYKSAQKNIKYYQAQRILVFLSPEDIKGEFRFKLFSLSKTAISKRFYTGYGLGNIDVAFYNITKTDTELKNILIDSSHNIFLDIFLYSGILGIISFCYFIYLLINVSNKLLPFYSHIIYLLILRGLTNITSVSMFFILFIIIGFIISTQIDKQLNKN